MALALAVEKAQGGFKWVKVRHTPSFDIISVKVVKVTYLQRHVNYGGDLILKLELTLPKISLSS